MIDLHCHILPGIDDGAQSIDDSIDMAEMAVKQGITHILCTPHHNNGKYDNSAGKVISCVSALQEELDRRKVPLTLFEGQEVRIGGELLEQIQTNDILFADLNNRYLLIEFPTNEIPAYSKQMFYKLLEAGHVPIIVHPERNSKFIEDPNRLLPFLEMGVLTQLTAPSYVGIFGSKIEKIAKQMVAHSMVYMMASDAHNIDKRGFFMKKAYDAIAADMGSDYVEAMQQMAKDILNGDDIQRPEFKEIKKKKFGLF
ncbi:protein-tyrosine phosphatase [Enterococcus haemoperoxidus ATCC BAA-382]|uniref:Tyrosine-protein phosphatase n=1 Tax=Enterococcus haemoperoxidus ATCC BAA-382 TaxID=1158608 RepID=R2TJ57_9ENTE|nr:CpsB/CapC family capsule biosynthesis tyrosine phosphatase [Enterococcus haemoperoxidus]EOI00172.1 protein-tyrosine phosphatase [Enterococcus haemoperoxidus ATCC BAA-382]EOT59590.1 protein-tyrosine phosphatase [Enterococcus haemoperoxidus ATCC BAA-382]OJG52427.1 protein-tyrosine phosphatase [Enterococcus haemoperoxidus]